MLHFTACRNLLYNKAVGLDLIKIYIFVRVAAFQLELPGLSAKLLKNLRNLNAAKCRTDSISNMTVAAQLKAKQLKFN